MGRKAKPTYLRVLEGNAGRRPLNTEEPEPAGDLTAPPHWLSDRQKETWRYAIEAAPPGLLKRLDASVFTVWVVACDMHREAAEKVTQYGSLIKSPNTGVPMQSPYVSIMNKQGQIMMKAASEMGFTPSSRSKVKISGKPKSRNNPFEGLRELPDE